MIGKNQVAVPTHFYKVVVAETEAGQLDMEAYVMPNQAIPNETPIANFLVRTPIGTGSHTRLTGLTHLGKCCRKYLS